MAWCPFAIRKPVSSHGGYMAADLGAVEHVTTNHFDPYGFFANPKDQASSHFWIADDGSLEQYIDTLLASWAQAGGNSQYVSVETSGTPDQPLTEAQLVTFARLYAWGHQVHDWPFSVAETPGQKGLGWHGMGGKAWGGHFSCPGDQRKGQRAEVLRRAAAFFEPKEIKPMYDPPIVVEPIVASLACPTGGFWQLGAQGGIYAWLGAPFVDTPKGKPYFAGRKPATFELPNPDEKAAGRLYVVVATSRERYAF